MMKISNVLAMAVLLGSGAAVAQNAGDVDVSFINEGGVIYKARPTGFTFNYGYGNLTSDGYLVPRAGQIRNGCFASTPWIPVGHPAGKAYAFPHFTLEWWGEMNPVAEPDDTLLRLVLEVKRANGQTQSVRKYIFTGMMDHLELRYINAERTQFYYYGRMDNLDNEAQQLYGTISVSQGDELRYNLCDLYEGGKLLVRDVTLQTFPVGH
ncbi:hypothetical protein [Melittangium boletus]|uniref:hypothetical protein n=1 Tax=Melittangium boletus TaxID=83453 RepID=UPI003DA5AD24